MRLRKILNLQREFTLFIAAYDFSSTDLSSNSELNKFCSRLFPAVGLDGQKQQTFSEMRMVGDLAVSLQGVEEQRDSTRLNMIILCVAVIAVGDFTYALAQDIVLESLSYWVRPLLLASAMLLGTFALLKLLVRRK